jgi:predicted transcriptional regulator
MKYLNYLKQDFNSIVKNMIRDSLITNENSLSYKIEQLKSLSKLTKVQ